MRMTLMQTLQSWFDWMWEYFRTGFHDVNAILGLLIAMVAAYFLSKYNRIFVAAFGALLAYVVAKVMLPVLDHNATFQLPPLVEREYWQGLIAVYAGFLIIISVFYLVKRRLFSGGGGGH
jgi:hypothetical protein